MVWRWNQLSTNIVRSFSFVLQKYFIRSRLKNFSVTFVLLEVKSCWLKIDFFKKNILLVVVISCGPRFEGNYLNGVSHFLEKLAFMVRNRFLSAYLSSQLYLSVNGKIPMSRGSDWFLASSECYLWLSVS